MKTLGTILLLIGLTVGTIFIVQAVKSDYQYENQYLSYWTLADKSSTIEDKAKYIDQFVAALKGAHLEGTHDALWQFTPDNSFDSNFQALQSLQGRLHTISTMDENSFQYQTAIQQITSQEQGEAQPMLDVFKDCWTKVHYPLLWNPFFSIPAILGSLLFIIIGIAALTSSDDF